MTKREQNLKLMADRVAAGLDPLSGTPRETCAWSIVQIGGEACCKGCGKRVVVGPKGNWVYAS